MLDSLEAQPSAGKTRETDGKSESTEKGIAGVTFAKPYKSVHQNKTMWAPVLTGISLFQLPVVLSNEVFWELSREKTQSLAVSSVVRLNQTTEEE